MLIKLTPLLAGILAASFSFAQTDTLYSYLRISFDSRIAANKNFVHLAAEPGNKYAEDLYSLKEVKIDEEDTYDPVYSIYATPQSKNKDSLIFSKGNNAFKNVTEGLNFLTQKNWELYLVENNIQTDGATAYSYENTIRLPAIVSKPVYIFRKKVVAL